MESQPKNLTINPADPPVDCGNWTDLQSKIAQKCDPSLSKLDDEISAALAHLIKKYESYITSGSMKRSLNR